MHDDLGGDDDDDDDEAGLNKTDTLAHGTQTTNHVPGHF
jgi:hypothetical protein